MYLLWNSLSRKNKAESNQPLAEARMGIYDKDIPWEHGMFGLFC